MQAQRVGAILACLCVVLVGCANNSSKPPSRTTCDASTASNRDIVLSFYKGALIGRQPRKAFERYTSPTFVEHKPDIPGGTREATITFLEQLIEEVPDPRWEVIRTVSEGDFVFLHARFTPAPGAPAYAIADIFRLDSCKIVEHWDVVDGPREQRPNPNSRF